MSRVELSPELLSIAGAISLGQEKVAKMKTMTITKTG